MKNINCSFGDQEYLRMLLAIEPNEVVLHYGKKCTVELTSALNEELKQKILTQDFSYMPWSSGTYSGKFSNRIGLFSGYKYNLSVGRQETSYEITFSDGTKDSIEFMITETNYNEILTLNRMSAEERKAWLQENADSYEEFKTCSIS